MTEDEIVGWHHRLDGHEFEQAPGDGDGQGSLVCCSSWGHKESGMTERLNNNSAPNIQSVCILFVCFVILATKSGLWDLSSPNRVRTQDFSHEIAKF